ncbi:hypothetical protein [Burkholderia multivorans]|uniref:hypothetical protein n=1 Tax=Burkholderia multivorans TaxID=87883 RepID=UPI002B248B1E|nr:hypothetical protein [Burkholderia multivorans]MEB2574348.1 hypothetical protein [Burkholderia multivorans]
MRQLRGRRVKQCLIQHVDRACAQRFVVARGVGRRVSERACQRERRRHVARERGGERRAVDRLRIVRTRARADEHRACGAAERGAACGDQRRGVGLQGQIGVEHGGATAERRDVGGGRFGVCARGAGAALQRDVPAAPRERRSERAPERRGIGATVERTGDERHARGRRIG